VVAAAVALVASACASSTGADTTAAPQPDSEQSTGAEIPPTPALDAVLVADGEQIYGQYCSACHGVDLSGDPNWKTPNADGSLLPPPHDTTGHTWHHSDALLLSLIRDGSEFAQTRMPTFGSTLTDGEIGAVLEYFKANWGPEERGFQWQVTWTDQQTSR
jgi:mono/diheme cytochrome c family protein